VYILAQDKAQLLSFRLLGAGIVVPLSLCPCSFRQIDAAAAATWPPPLNHVRAMLLSKWSRSSTQGWQARCIVRGLSAYHTSPGRLAVSRSLRVWTELHQAIKVLVLMEQYFLVHAERSIQNECIFSVSF
jgi:hypothetical protein